MLLFMTVKTFSSFWDNSGVMTDTFGRFNRSLKRELVFAESERRR